MPADTSDVVLVTGAFGLVGRMVVKRLVADGRTVVATDLDNPPNRKVAASLAAANLTVRWANLTKPDEVQSLLNDAAPGAIIHLAAVIPPMCYANRNLARAVNVDATGLLVRAAEGMPTPPRFVLASSVAVYGSRNPYRTNEILTADTPTSPTDLYGGHKVEAERIVTTSSLEWLILRLGGVLSTEPDLSGSKLDFIFFEGLLPTDGRIQMVDVRDVAHAFSAATTVDVTREVFLIGGENDSMRLFQGQVIPAVVDAIGLVNGMPKGRRGNPDDDLAWFATDWMDTARSQQVLGFQRHSLSDVVGDLRATVGPLRYVLRLIAPLARLYFNLRSPYFRAPGQHADPWRLMRTKWGDPAPDATSLPAAQ